MIVIGIVLVGYGAVHKSKVSDGLGEKQETKFFGIVLIVLG